ncbi:MAG: hypothetical protein E7247_25265 [Paenibacillaceae bacterium]|nr:hypothetical protein [Paenibacillaceae bacterium]
MDTLVLENNNEKLKLIACNTTWYQVVYETNKKTMVIGANSIDRILKKLLLHLFRAEEVETFNYKGIDYFSILNLMSPHSVIAGRYNKDEELEIHLLDDSGNTFHLFTLDKDTRLEWIKLLVEFTIGKILIP